VAVADRNLTAAPENPDLSRTKADCLESLALILVETGRYKEGQDADQQAVALFRPLAEGDNSGYLDQIMLAMTLTEWSRSFREKDDPQNALPRVTEAIQWLTALVERPLESRRRGRYPEVVIRDNARYILALAQTELGGTLSGISGQRAKAVQAFDKAIEGLMRIGAASSPVAGRRRALGLAYIGRGSCLAAQGNMPGAERDWAEARNVLVKLAADFPHNASFQGSLGLVLGYLGRRELEKGDKPAARPLLEQAIGHYWKVLDANPDSPLYGAGLPRIVKDLEAAGGAAAR
jgi:tetratricopeptide (TPR) repeat protein